MSKGIKAFENAMKKKIKNQNKIPKSLLLNIILKELRDKGNFLSCVLTDTNGFIIGEAIHPRDNKDNLQATSALITNTSERISDYLKLDKIHFSYFVSNDTIVWLKVIKMAKSKDKFILLVTKRNSLINKMTNSTLKLLGKEKINVPEYLDVTSKWILNYCYP